MPPTRRKPSTPSTQPTLAFGPRANKVTKPSTHPSTSKNLSKTTPSTSQPTKSLSTSETASPEPAATAAPNVPKEEIIEIPNADRGLAFRVQGHPEKDELDEQARKVSEKDIKAYWKGKEDERKAPRVHQQSIPLHEKLLRHFDLSSQYGPCIGVARMKRWKRANRLGLKPPFEVLAVLVKEEDGGRKGSERAYVDELMSTRLVVE